MRSKSALAVVAIFAITAAVFFVKPNRLRSQEQPAPQAASSSLALGAAFDRDAQVAFQKGLQPDELSRLIYLDARLALADPARPLPAGARSHSWSQLSCYFVSQAAQSVAVQRS